MERILNVIRIIYYSLASILILLTFLGISGPILNLKWLAWLQNTIAWPIWGLFLYSFILIIMITALIHLYRTIKERQDFAIQSAIYGKGNLTINRTKQVRAKVTRRLKMEASNPELGITEKNDPCKRTHKELAIVYYHNGQKRTKTIPENEGVRLPELEPQD